MSHDPAEPTIPDSSGAAVTQDFGTADTSGRIPNTSWQPAQQVPLPPDGYRIEREIAQGGMGRILEVDDRKLGRVVAMKMMRAEGATTESARVRFVREAMVLARLEHPNIVPIHDLGQDEHGRPFYTMKLVRGRTLQAILDGLARRDAEFIGQYTLDRLLTIFRKVCDAMSLAHARGVVHRDLKPDNIMVGAFGEVLVMDWGLARIQSDAQQDDDDAPGGSGDLLDSGQLTMEGSVMGTPRYMSPEQARGIVAEVDQQSDVFSLGGILYAILTLNPPVDGKTAKEILSRILLGQILPPTTFNPTKRSSVNRSGGGRAAKVAGSPRSAADPATFQTLPHCPGHRVPSALSAVAMRALGLEKSKRYKTVAQLAADIEAYQSGFATSAQEAGFVTLVRLLIARRRREFSIALGAWLVLMGLGIWFVIDLRASERETRRQAGIAKKNEANAIDQANRAGVAENRAIGQAQRATTAEHKAMASANEALREKESAQRALMKSAITLAEAARREGNGLAMQNALNEVPAPLRDATWHYLWDESDTSIARVAPSAQPGWIDGVAADPSRPGVFAVVTNMRGKLVTRDIWGEHVLDTPNAGLRVKLVDAHRNATLLDFDAPFGNSRVIAVAHDGKRIALAAGGENEPNRISIHSSADGKVLQEWDAPTVARLEFSPDDKLLLEEEKGAAKLTLWDTAGGKVAWTYEPKSGNHALGAFTADGAQVVTYNPTENFRVVKAADGSFIRGFKKGQEHSVLSFAVGPKGTVGTLSDGGFATMYNLADGHVLSQFRVSTGMASFIGFMSDGDLAVTAAPGRDGSQAITVWKIASGDRVGAMLGGVGDLHGVALHPITNELIAACVNTGVWNFLGASPSSMIHNNGRVMPPFFYTSDQFLFAAGPKNRLGLQRIDDKGITEVWQPPDHPFDCFNLSAGGNFAAASNNLPNNRRLILLKCDHDELQSGFTMETIFAPLALRISPRGDRLAMISFQHLMLGFIDARNGSAFGLDQLVYHRCWDFAWLGNDRGVGVFTTQRDRGDPGCEERIETWNAADNKLICSKTHTSGMNVLAVSPDMKQIAEAGVDQMVRIRDGESLEVLQEFRAHDGAITALAWHPRGSILATAGEDLTIKLWDVQAHRKIAEFRGLPGVPLGICFSPSGKRLACSSDFDGTRIWDLPPFNAAPADHPSPGPQTLPAH